MIYSKVAIREKYIADIYGNTQCHLQMILRNTMKQTNNHTMCQLEVPDCHIKEENHRIDLKVYLIQHESFTFNQFSEKTK